MIRLAPRPVPSTALALLAPLAALALTVAAGALLFALLGKDPGRALSLFFIEPLRSPRALGEVALKATPLALIALGLAVSFRANVWNIGAEGQYILGAIFATAVALHAGEASSRAIVIPIVLAGVAGGMLWAALVAFLRDRFNASEILVSLMLVYGAELLLGYLVYGPWRDPQGFNFPQTITFLPATQIPRLVSGQRAHAGLIVAVLAAAGLALFLFRTFAGFQLAVGGMAPGAARYAGFSSRRALWTALLISGGMAGMAGAFEVAGPLGQLTPHLPVGYGFAAIIVAFVGRLQPLGVLLSSVLMSMFYIGGELAQSRLGLPRALTGVFQGLLLFALLACDALAQLRVVRRVIDAVTHFVAASVNAGTVLALAALGLLINERAGVVNLGAEGLMLVGALAGYAVAAGGHGAALALLAGAGAALVLALAFGGLVIWLGTNQYATGLALTLFGSGFAAFAGTRYTQLQLPDGVPFHLPVLGDWPVLGTALFGYHPIVYLTWALGAGLGWFLFRARGGLILRGVGESPGAAQALGHPVRLVRLGAVACGGALCGVAGAYVSVIYTRLWVEGLISGRGWIALALTTFATWRPGRVLLGAYLFGAVTMLQFHLQARGVSVDSHLLQMLPYLATIVVLVLISRDPAWIRLNMPASLGKPFRPDQ